MSQTLFFYDLETSGFNPKEARIMQFAGQRTNLQLEPIGEPANYLIKMTSDVLPSPQAILVTHITPQQTIAEGLNEADFLKIFYEQIALPQTVFVGYNSTRFDDEFMRFLNYRNFYDPYEWQWKDGRSRWDLLDLIRMCRALRPGVIKWPKDDAGKDSNRLELLAKANHLDHFKAHDALSDVEALIGLARLVKKSQPKLWDYLFEIMRDKKKIAQLADSGNPFVYTSGKYSSDFYKTTVVTKLVDHPTRTGCLTYDLRYDPSELKDLSVEELLKLWSDYSPDTPPFPVKTLQFNRCPAVAPLAVLDEKSQERIKLTTGLINENYEKLKSIRTEFTKKILSVQAKLDLQQDKQAKSKPLGVGEDLYSKFIDDKEKPKMAKVRQANPSELTDIDIIFDDIRLNGLLPLYKARNYPASLTNEDKEAWEKHCTEHLIGDQRFSRANNFFKELYDLSLRDDLTSDDQFILEEIKLYAESILPEEIFIN